MPLLKQCSHRNCRKLLPDGVKFCDYHQAKYEAQERIRYKEYKLRRLKDIEQKKFQEFYNTEAWKRIRKAVISDYLGIDIYEYYSTGRIVAGERVHHIIELSEDWSCRLDSSNLIYLTEKNHGKIHAIYNTNNKNKFLMQTKLFDTIDRFNKEFKI